MEKKNIKNIKVYKKLFNKSTPKILLKLILIQQIVLISAPTLVCAKDFFITNDLSKETTKSSSVAIKSHFSKKTGLKNAETKKIVADKNDYLKEVTDFYGIDKEIVVEVADTIIDAKKDNTGDIDYDDVLLDSIKEKIATENISTDQVSLFEFGTSGQETVEEIKNSEIGLLYNKYGNMYGVDPNLLMARDMQESRLSHTSFNPNGAYGISQIEHTLFGQTTTVFNYETNSYEEIMITEEGALELDTNIQYGAMKMQERIRSYDNNIFVALQAYNYGSSMNIVLDNYALASGKTKEQILGDKTDFGWISYVDDFHNNPSKYINWNEGTYGDNLYISHIMRYIFEDTITIKDSNGDNVICNLKTNKSINSNENRFSNYVENIEDIEKTFSKKR